MRSRRRLLTIAGVLAALAGLAAAAIALNLALLGYAQPRNDPVGKLSPRAVLPAGPGPTVTLPVAPSDSHDEPDD